MVNGETLTRHQGQSVLIRPYVTGQVIEDLDNDQVSQVGTALARLHEIPAPGDLPNQHMYVAETYPKIVEQEIDQKYKKWIEQRYNFLMKNIPLDLPVGLGHGDLFTDNILFEEEKLKAFLDFESVCRMYKAFDLGMTAVGICAEDEEIVINKVRALVDGYQEVRSLEQKEKDSLQIFIECTAILTSAWRFWKYNMDAPDTEKSNKYMQMVNIAKNVSAIPKEEFNNAVFVG
jgi:homoserine kinase type II